MGYTMGSYEFEYATKVVSNVDTSNQLFYRQLSCAVFDSCISFYMYPCFLLKYPPYSRSFNEVTQLTRDSEEESGVCRKRKNELD